MRSNGDLTGGQEARGVFGGRRMVALMRVPYRWREKDNGLQCPKRATAVSQTPNGNAIDRNWLPIGCRHTSNLFLSTFRIRSARVAL
jgi:hypothetical protein